MLTPADHALFSFAATHHSVFDLRDATAVGLTEAQVRNRAAHLWERIHDEYDGSLNDELVVRTRQMTPIFSSSSPPRRRGPRACPWLEQGASGAASVAPGYPLSRA